MFDAEATKAIEDIVNKCLKAKDEEIAALKTESAAKDAEIAAKHAEIAALAARMDREWNLSPDIIDGKDCPVCLLPLLCDLFLGRTECMHIFHMDCFMTSWEYSESCPVCRAKIERCSRIRCVSQEASPERWRGGGGESKASSFEG